MSFDKDFDYIFDKALFDSILVMNIVIQCSKDPDVGVNKLLSNVYESLRPGGSYIIVSFGLIGIRMSYLDNLDWKIQHTILTSANDKEANNRYNLYICKKDDKS